MAEPFTTLTLTQGVTVHEVDIHAAHNLSEGDQLFGGFTTLRAANGRAIKQTHWAKRRITYQGSGAVDPGLGVFDFAEQLILDSPSLDNTPLTMVSDGVVKTRDVHGAVVSWSLVLEEA